MGRGASQYSGWGEAMSKPTKGPWIPEEYRVVDKDGNVICHAIDDMDADISLPSIPGREKEVQPNMELIAEAGTVFHETGLTPRELKEQRDALLIAVKNALETSQVASVPGLYWVNTNEIISLRAAIAATEARS